MPIAQSTTAPPILTAICDDFFAFDVDRASRKVTNANTRQIPALTKGEIHSMKAARQIGTRASSSSQCISRLKIRFVSALYR